MVNMCNGKDRGHLASENIIDLSANEIRKRWIKHMKQKTVTFEMNMDLRLGRSLTYVAHTILHDS